MQRRMFRCFMYESIYKVFRNFHRHRKTRAIFKVLKCNLAAHLERTKYVALIIGNDTARKSGMIFET